MYYFELLLGIVVHLALMLDPHPRPFRLIVILNINCGTLSALRIKAGVAKLRSGLNLGNVRFLWVLGVLLGLRGGRSVLQVQNDTL